MHRLRKISVKLHVLIIPAQNDSITCTLLHDVIEPKFFLFNLSMQIA